MSWEVALNAAGRFLAAILIVGGVEVVTGDVGVGDGGRETLWSCDVPRNSSIRGRRFAIWCADKKVRAKPLWSRAETSALAGEDPRAAAGEKST